MRDTLRVTQGIIMPPVIQSIRARQILDSRGNPTVECDVTLSGGAMGRAAVPSGASTGENEAVELRDGDISQYLGRSVHGAVQTIEKRIAPAIMGMDARDQEAVDLALIEMDGTENKSNLGANAILGVSLAIAKAAAEECGQPLYQYLGGEDARILPAPMMNILNGGQHADNTVDFQEFMIQPWGFPTFGDALRAGVETYHALKGVLSERGLCTAIGDEGGFAPDLDDNEDALRVIEEAVGKAGYSLGDQMFIALDPAASELVNEARKRGAEGYCFFSSNPKRIATSDEMIDVWADWCTRYPIRSIEDGLGEDDWDGWKALTSRLGDNIQLVGDDIFVTNPAYLQRGIDTGCANSVLVKLNQIGTLTEAHAAVRLGQENGYTTVISHRSGETEDASIADIAVAWGCGQIKTGAPCRSDRNAKYNQLIRIAEDLGSRAVYAGDG